MDEMDKRLAALIDEARTAHDPTAADARRVGAALGVALPSLAAGSTLFSGAAAHAATEVASQAAASATVVKGAWLASMGTAKMLGVAAVIAVGTAVGVQSYTARPAHEGAPAASPAPRARAPRVAQQAPAPKLVPAPAPAIEPASPPPTSIEVQASASRPASARRIEAGARAGARTNEELQLIERALQALHARELEQADRALHEHGQRFPSGTLAEERLGLQVIVECSRGNTLAAEPLRARFLELAPESPLAAKIERACAR